MRAGMSVIGSLKDTKLADVMQLFSSGKKTGRLTVSGEEIQAVLRFQKGAVIHATAGRLQGEDAVFDLFGWEDGELTFVMDDKAVTPNITKGVNALIEEGLRVGRTRHRMHEAIPSDRVVFQLGPGPEDPQRQVTLSLREWRILRLVDGIRDVREIVEASRQPRQDVASVIVELVDAGFLERLDLQRSLKAVSHGLFGKDAAEVDDRLDVEWRKALRFVRGAQRAEVRGPGGRAAVVPIAFRAGLAGEIHLPRGVLSEIGARDGESIQVRPAP